MADALPRIREILDEEGMQLSRGVVEAVIEISKGDMRKIINLFQNIHLKYAGLDDQSSKIELESGIGSECSAEDVYRLTGTLAPQKVRSIFESLMNDSVETCMESVENLLQKADANVASVLPGLTELALLEIRGDRHKALKMDVLNVLADVEKKAARDIPEDLLRDYLVSQFYILRQMGAGK